MCKGFEYAGSVSEGTMRNEDLIPRFLSVLEDLDEEALVKIETEYQAVLDAEEWGCEDADFLMEALFDALNDAAPEGYWFGASDGDGASYGFWQSEDECEEEEEVE